jgi:hypothetical protein
MKKIYADELAVLSLYDMEVFSKKYNIPINVLEEFVTGMIQKEYDSGSFLRSEYCYEIKERLFKAGYDEGYVDGLKSLNNEM